MVLEAGNSNNYRSCSQIIKLNNLLFEDLFKRGRSYEGKDKFKVDVIYQKSPGEEAGELNQFKVDLVAGGKVKKPTSRQIDRLESDYLFMQIQKIKESYPEEGICLLYSKLGPSNHLVPKLIDSQIGFCCQVKVELKEDPLIAMFVCLIEALVTINVENNEKKIKVFLQNTAWLIERYFVVLGFDCDSSFIKNKIEDFCQRSLDWGIYSSFLKFIIDYGRLKIIMIIELTRLA